jgi:caffeoyl-CoA O-methyltransferase
MKDRIDAILRRPQAEYLERLLPPRDALLAKIEAFAAEHGHPIADPEVAQLERILVRLRKPKRIVEVGTNIGYSVIVMGRELDAGSVLETIEIDRGTLEVARGFVAEAGLSCHVVFHEGPALEVLSRLESPIDLAFIDCVKTEYGDYLDRLLPRMASGSVIICDNLLWKGQVAEGPRSESEARSTAALSAFNERITRDPRLLTTVLAVGDGVGISIVR